MCHISNPHNFGSIIILLFVEIDNGKKSYCMEREKKQQQQQIKSYVFSHV